MIAFVTRLNWQFVRSPCVGDCMNGTGIEIRANKVFSGMRSRHTFGRTSFGRVDRCAIGKREGLWQLALRRKVGRNVIIKGGETLKFRARPLKMLRPGSLPASRRIGSASAGGSNPSWGSLRIISFFAEEYYRANYWRFPNFFAAGEALRSPARF